MSILFISTSVWAQLYHESLYNTDKQLSVNDIIQQTESHFERNSRDRGNGYKQFQRWKYWARRNMDKNGQVRNNDKALEEYTLFSRQNRNVRAFAGNYVELGPQSAVNTSTWSSALGRVSAIGLDPNDESHIIVGSPSGGIWKTNDLGDNWTPIFDDQALIDVYSLEISHSNPNHYWAGLRGKVVRSLNGGLSWTDVSGEGNDRYNTIEMHPSNANLVFAVGVFNGIVYRSTNGGANFIPVLDHTDQLHDLEFHPTNSMIIYASGNGAAFKSTDGGANFNQIKSGLPENTMMLAVTPAAPSNVYILEETGGGLNAIYLSTNEGQSWTTITDNSQNYLHRELNELGGQAPRDMDIIVSPDNKNIIHVAGIETYRSTNLGGSWTKTTSWTNPGGSNFIHADIDLLIYDTNRIIAGTDGGIYYSTNEGTSWTDITPGLGIRQFYRIGASQTDPDRVSGGSQDNGTGILRSGVWYDWLGADGMETFIDWSNSNTVYGTSQYGTLYKSTNGGQSRTSITTPDADVDGNWVTPFEQDSENSNTIYTAKYDVWKSTNGGFSWTSILSLPALADEMKIAPTDSDYIYVSYDNILYRTTNGGATWTSTTLPGYRVNYIAVHPLNPEKLSVTISGGDNTKVMESQDAGSTFTNITSNLPSGVGIECIAYEDKPNGGLFAGGNPGIYYTSSTVNSSWQDNSNNLPNVRIAELDIRNGVMYVATFGRGLWKIDLEAEFICEDFGGDADQDGICAADDCDDTDAAVGGIGSSCDDGLASTKNDVYTTNCQCQGVESGITVCIQINNGNDDVEENGNDGSMYITSSDLELTDDGSSQIVGLRFSNMAVPPSAEILDAYIQFTTDEVTSGNTSLKIEGHAIAHAPGFSNQTNAVSSRNKTTENVSWNVPAWTTTGAAGTAERSPNIAGIIQEIVNIDGYAEGNSLAIIITGIGKRTAESFEGSNSQAPELCIEYKACPTQGTICDDGNECTIGDTQDGNCNCIGLLIQDSDNDGVCDVLDECPDFNDALIGTSCDDGNPCTTGESFNTNCLCSGGVEIDSDNDGVCDAFDECPNFNDALNGTPCDDGDACTVADEYTDCNCIGLLIQDSDNDGVCDVLDECPGLDDAMIGMPCDDGNENNMNDVYTSNCICEGTLIPQSVCVQINNGEDDVEEREDGSMYITSSDLELTEDGQNQTIGLRFRNIAVPQFAEITNAYIQFTTDEETSVTTSLTIQGEAVANAPALTAQDENVSSRSRTRASMSWNVPVWTAVNAAGSAQQTPDISDIIQEIVSIDGYAEGNDLVIIITGSGERVAESFEGSNADAPELCIEYQTCPMTITALNNELMTTNQAAALTIESNNIIPSNVNVSFSAGESVELTTAFEVKLGATFEVFIQSCL